MCIYGYLRAYLLNNAQENAAILLSELVNIAMILLAGEFMPQIRPLQYPLHGFWSTAPTLSNIYYNSCCACAVFTC